jgi:hypothetical protein
MLDMCDRSVETVKRDEEKPLNIAIMGMCGMVSGLYAKGYG